MRALAHAALATALMGCVATGCASPSSPDTQSVGRTAPTQPHSSDARSVGTGGDLIPIVSDNVAMAGYNDATRVMTVLFESARVYEYYDVPPQLWESFIAAQPDPWSLVGYPQLVQGGYAYQEVT